MTAILLIDDHPLFHEGLASAFARLAPDIALRQIEVLALLSQGHSNKVIADRTVRAHLTQLFQTLGVASRAQAMVVARKRGLVA